TELHRARRRWPYLVDVEVREPAHLLLDLFSGKRRHRAVVDDDDLIIPSANATLVLRRERVERPRGLTVHVVNDHHHGQGRPPEPCCHDLIPPRRPARACIQAARPSRRTCPKSCSLADRPDTSRRSAGELP